MTITTPAVPEQADPPTTAESGILCRAACEFGLTGLLLFFVVTGVRRLVAPGSPISAHDIHYALAVLGVTIGVLLTGFMMSPPGRRSGGHLNPAVTIALWRLGAFPARAVVPYITAQLIIATFGPLSGGSADPARQFGPALLAQDTTHLWIYLLAPVLGAVLGAALVALAKPLTTQRPRC
ncbi:MULTISPECIES: aquaporin [unclassified Streptomyces]|uniref:aquaporin n=1 Tax=Streptomyces sp. NPDC055082 TaxID=3365718 RepID=UPI0037D3E5D9